MQPAQDVLEEPRIFSGLPAWFSSSVQENRKNAWINCGGRVVNFEEALFVFSEDFEAEDTKHLYKTKAYLSESLTVFHALYIEDCISAGQAKAVDIGFYALPPASVYDRLKETLQNQGGEHHCLYKWEAVNCSVCSSEFLRNKPATTSTATPTAPSVHQAFSDYVDIEMLEEPNYNELEEFVVGSNGAEIFMKEQ